LTIKGKRKRPEVKEEDYYCCEQCYGDFSRTISLPTEVDTEKINTTYRNGIVEIHLSKSEKARPKAIKVKVG